MALLRCPHSLDFHCRTLVFLAVLLIVPSADAATIRVAKDGTGDFSVIYDACQAAADGDTIRVAAGVYPELRDHQYPACVIPTVGFVNIPELTIIGDGVDVVTIGPEEPPASFTDGPYGIVGSYFGNTSLHVEGMAFRHLRSGVFAQGESVVVTGCKFERSYYGLDANVSGVATVRRSEFREIENRGIMMFRSLNAQGGLIEDCTFIDCQLGIDLQPPNCELRDSEFLDCYVGAQVSFGGSCLIERCLFQANSGGGLVISDGAQVQLFDSEFTGPTELNIFLSGALWGSGNLLSDSSYTAVRTFYYSFADFKGNHILNGGGYSIEAPGGGPPVRTQDWSGNYWGTSDPAQVSEWIFDTNDDPEFRYINIQYEPMAEQPIGTETTTFGEWKARFGGR